MLSKFDNNSFGFNLSTHFWIFYILWQENSHLRTTKSFLSIEQLRRRLFAYLSYAFQLLNSIHEIRLKLLSFQLDQKYKEKKSYSFPLRKTLHWSAQTLDRNTSQQRQGSSLILRNNVTGKLRSNKWWKRVWRWKYKLN